jgi:superfamily II DNA/RNA helicase
MQKLLKLFNYVLCSTIMGGENPKKEKAKLRKGLTVVVCTPGRLLYHLQNTQNINFSRLQAIIIDEADRLLDMGFEREMTQCLEELKKRCPEKFTTEKDLFHSDSLRVNFVSATLSQKVELLGAKLMKDY